MADADESHVSSATPDTVSVTSTFTATTEATTAVIRQVLSTATTTCTVRQAVPTVVLARPTALMGSSTSAPSFVDDTYTTVDLPFPLQIGQNSSSHIFVTSNAVLSLYTGSASYVNSPIPTTQLPTFSALGFWDDTVINQGQPQGIFYQIDNGNRVTFEYYLSHYQAAGEYYHFLISYSASNPGVFTYTYYQVSDLGASATVGMQYADSG
ncbi:MAG: hypothetical protein L6R39_004834, partial [Caloplaca ligustica]